MKKTLLFQLAGSLIMLSFTLVFPTYAIQIALATIMGYLLEIIWNQDHK